MLLKAYPGKCMCQHVPVAQADCPDHTWQKITGITNKKTGKNGQNANLHFARQLVCPDQMSNSFVEDLKVLAVIFTT